MGAVKRVLITGGPFSNTMRVHDAETGAELHVRRIEVLPIVPGQVLTVRLDFILDRLDVVAEVPAAK